MPLVGLVEPQHDAKKKDMAGVYPPWRPVQEILDDLLVAGPKYSPWPYELARGAILNHQERGNRLSVTALVGGCMRGNIIERKEDYVGSLDGMYPSYRGVSMHAALETVARAGSLAEWRFYTNVDGQEISGSPDLITYDTVWDWKTTENPPTYGYMYESHKLQLQFNRFCFNNATKWDSPSPDVDPTSIPLDPYHTRINHLAIVYLTPKGPKVIEHQKTVKQQTRAGGERSVKVPDVWDDQLVLDELRPRMEAWSKAWAAFPNWPAGLENYPGWAGPPAWECPGPPLCNLPNCMAKRYPNGLTWPSP